MKLENIIILKCVQALEQSKNKANRTSADSKERLYWVGFFVWGQGVYLEFLQVFFSNEVSSED